MYAKLMRSLDTPRLYGRFSMTVYDVKNGKPQIVTRIQKKNQVVDDGRRVMLELLCQLDIGSLVPEQNQIWSLAVGTIGTPPQVTDTGLLGQVWTEAFLIPECVLGACPPYEIQIYKTLPPAAAIGEFLREAGVFTRGDNDDPLIAVNRRMYCRQTHPVIEKTATMSIAYDWRLGITAE